MPTRRSDYLLLDQAADSVLVPKENIDDIFGFGVNDNTTFAPERKQLHKSTSYGVSAETVSYNVVEKTAYRQGGYGTVEKPHPFWLPGDRVSYGKGEKVTYRKAKTFNYGQLEKKNHDEALAYSLNDRYPAYMYADTSSTVSPDSGYPSHGKNSYNSVQSDRGPFVTDRGYYLSSDRGMYSLDRKGSISSEPPSYARGEVNNTLERLERSGSGGRTGPYVSSSLVRQSSGGSCSDSLIASDYLGASPNQSLNNLSDSTFLNSLYVLEAFKRDGIDPAGTGGTSMDFLGESTSDEGPKSWLQQSEQSYSLQMALALRLMADAELTEELRLLGSHFKEIGQASSCSAARRSVEATSHRFWVNGSLGYSDKVQDGFYQVWGMNPYVWNMCNHSDEGGRMPSLESLRVVDPVDSALEVVLVDQNGDSHLRDVKEKALVLALKAVDRKQLAEQLGKLVCSEMGGVFPLEHGDLMYRWHASSQILKDRVSSVVLPLGSLHVGLCRHRALLYKVLADSINLPCRIARGCKYCEADDGASCLVLCSTDSEYLVNLISRGGALSDPEAYMNSSSALAVASPLRFPQYGTTRISEEDRNWRKEFAAEFSSSGISSSDSRLVVTANSTEEVARKKAADRTNLWLTPAQTPNVSGSALEPAGVSPPKPSDQLWQNTLRSPFNNPTGHEDRINSPLVTYSGHVNPNLRNSGGYGGENLQSVAECEVLATVKGVPSRASFRGRLTKGDLSSEKLNGIMQHEEPGKPNREACGPQLDSAWAYADPLRHTVDPLMRAQNLERSMRSDNWEAPWEAPWEGTGTRPLVGQTCSCFHYMDSANTGHLADCSDGLGYHTGSSDDKCSDEMETVAEEWEIGWDDIILKEKIGAGSFGTVHRADWQGSDVAVKILMEQDVHDERLKEFMREVAIMKRLRHPNVVLFMGAVTRRPNLSIVTEFMPRGSLFRLLHRSGTMDTLDECRRIRMALDVAKGMNYLHRSNPPIVHRDLKSPNLLVDKTWTVKVCDFGLSRFKGHTYLTSRSGAGTPEWMAPEVLRDEPSNEKSDVYSFGVVLWELVTLQQPWTGLTPVQVVGAVGFQNQRLLIPKEMNPEIADIIKSCWLNDARERPSFSTLMELLKPLQKAIVLEPLRAHTPCPEGVPDPL